MRGQLGVVEVLEAGEHFQIFVKVLSLMLVVEVSHAWMPQVLVEQRDVLLDGGREVTAGKPRTGMDGREEKKGNGKVKQARKEGRKDGRQEESKE